MKIGIIYLIFALTVVSREASGQKILYGVNLDKAYPEIKNEGSINLSKEVILKDNSVFYSVRISSQDFVFSAVHSGFAPFLHPERYYKKGLNDIKKVFGDPINICTDTSLTTKTSDFYIWKIKREEGYFFIYYGLSRFGLSLDIERMYDEGTVNYKISHSVGEEELFRKKFYYFNGKELNMPD